ncbi:hypothetical protein PVK06_047121 [Gossypium arboreum]|uniref:Uncharacterized protein n=1 Tax=Gossypium arboreum TaxID=29729 RepID=A0ABR0MED1_GOSAR|nr:hypothetical protein PVK06_047121 [Gossypium arboreum]
MRKCSDEPLCDSYRMPSCKTTRTTNSEVLSNMLDMMAQMIKIMQEISEALPSRKEDMSEACNLDQKNPCIIDDHDENYGEIQPELVTEELEEELDIVEMVSDPTDIVTYITVKVEVIDELTINMELKPIVNGSV